MKAFLKRLCCSPLLIAAVALGWRLVILWWTWHRAAPTPLNEPYGFEMGHVAQSIASGRGFSSPLSMVQTGPTAWCSPIYPSLIAGIFKMWGIYSTKSHIVIQALNCLFSALTVFPIYSIAKRSFGIGVAVLASWLWVVLPAAWNIPLEDIWDRMLAALALVLIFSATLHMREAQSSLRSWIASGAIWSIGALISPSLLSTLPFLLGWLIWQLRKASASWLRPVAVAILVFALGLAPWTIRNYLLFGGFIPLRSNFALELWLGNNPAALEVDTFKMHPMLNRSEADDYRRMGETAYMRAKRDAALTFMRSHPATAFYFMLRRIGTNWFAVSDRADTVLSRGWWYMKFYFFVNALMIFFAWFGAVVAWRAQNPYRAPYLFVLFAYPLVFYLTHTLVRYRFPMVPILVILGTYGLSCALTLSLESPIRRWAAAFG